MKTKDDPRGENRNQSLSLAECPTCHTVGKWSEKVEANRSWAPHYKCLKCGQVCFTNAYRDTPTNPLNACANKEHFVEA